MQNTALIILALALVTAAAPGKAASACDVQYTHVNNAWRAASNECCADEDDDGRCLGPNVTDRSGWIKPTPNKTMGYKNMADSSPDCNDYLEGAGTALRELGAMRCR